MRSGADVYRFGPFELDSARARLFRGNERVPVSGPQAQILLLLASNSSEVVSKEALANAAWHDVAVTYNSIDQAISRLRKTLGRQDAGAPYIETVPGRGYRFVAPVERAERHDANASLDARLAPFRAFLEGQANLDTLNREAIVRARRVFEDVLRLAPHYAPAHVGLANACSLIFESTRADAAPVYASLKVAVHHAVKGVELEPSWAEAWSTLAFVLCQDGETGEAAAAACKAVDLDPEDWRHALRLGYVSFGEQRLRAARRVLALCPGLALAYWLMATVFVARGAFDAALDVLQKGCAAQDAQPKTMGRFHAVGLHLLHALVLAALGKVDEAIAQLTCELEYVAGHGQLYARECAANSSHALGALYLRQGRRADAEAAFRQAMKVVPGHAFASAALAIDAPPRQFAPRDPNAIDAVIAQAIALARGGRHPDAARVCGEGLSQAPRGPAAWSLPAEPFLNPAARPEIWAQTLAILRDRAA